MSSPRTVWVYKSPPGWKPGIWLRTVERGKRAGYYVVELLNVWNSRTKQVERKLITVHPDQVKPRD